MMERQWRIKTIPSLGKRAALALAVGLSILIGGLVHGITWEEVIPTESDFAESESRSRENGNLGENPGPAGVTDAEAELLGRMIAAEAEGEPFQGKVAVGAVIVNRIRSASFPNSLREVIHQPRQFQPVRNGRFWRVGVGREDLQAARAALAGRDPTGGASFFFAPGKTDDAFMWSRPVIMDIGNHRFTH